MARKRFFLLLCLLLLFLVLADTESLDVATCTGATCSVAGLNSDDTAQDGATIGKGGTLSTTWSNTAFSASSTIDNVTFIVTHGGATGIDGNFVVTLRNAAATITYCTFTYLNVVSDTKRTETDTSSCAWTKARLDDLVITYNNGDNKGPQNAYVSFTDLIIYYTPPDTTDPHISLNSPGNQTWDLDGDVTFVYTPSDAGGLSDCSLYVDGSYNQSNSTSLANGGQNNFSLLSIPDGNHTWWVNCTDTSGNSNVSVTRQIRIDTTGPTVNLEAPANDNVSSESGVMFYYNATDLQTGLAQCELIINDSIIDTDNSPVEGVSLNFTASLSNGGYTWWVNCTDTNGFETMSEQRNITINTTLPTISPDKASYTLGETVIITGENFNSVVGVTINYTLPNTTVISKTNTTTAGGTFNSYLTIGYGYPNGTYSVFAYQTNDHTENASTTFDVDILPTSILVSPDPVTKGDQITITGSDFTPSSSVNITLVYFDGTNDTFLTTSDTNGDVSVGYNISYTVSEGLANATAFDVNYPRMNASDTFTIENRTAALRFSPATYGRDEFVNIYGYNFTRLGLTSLFIYDNTTEDLGSGFPVNKSADDTGYFTHQWSTNSWCNGIYRVEAIDQSNAFLNDTKFFTIEELISNEDIVHSYGGWKYASATTQSTINPANVNVSDGNYESFGNLNQGTEWYFEFNFTNNYNRGLFVDSVSFQIEHAETTDLTNPEVRLWNGSAYNTICTGLVQSGTDHNDTCDLSSAFSDPAQLDLVSVRFVLQKGNGPETATVNYVHLNITTSYEPTCTYFNGSGGGGLAANPPYFSAITLEDNVLAPAEELDLNAGTTKEIYCNVTVNDNDGYTDIDYVNATLFSESVTLNSPDNETNHYTNTSCTLISWGGNTANYSCSFFVQYFAENGTWTCTAETTDGTDGALDSDTSSMNPLYALNISATLLNYGNLSEGELSLEKRLNITNFGNMPINFSVTGYGTTRGDGLSFDCPQENLSIGVQRYAFSSGAYASKTPLTSSLVTTPFTIPATQDATPSLTATYWQLEIPSTDEPKGLCNGTLLFQAEVS